MDKIQSNLSLPRNEEFNDVTAMQNKLIVSSVNENKFPP